MISEETGSEKHQNASRLYIFYSSIFQNSIM